MIKKEENQLLVFESKVLRTISGPKIENDVYRRRYSHELDKKFSSLHALKCHKDKQIALRWSHEQKTRRAITKSSIQSQTQWMQKSRKTEIQVGGWENNDILALGIRDWTHCAQDRQTWRDVHERKRFFVHLCSCYYHYCIDQNFIKHILL
jgi:hypothetical protein